MKRIAMIAVLTLGLAALVACGGDTQGVETVAIVNGESISADELDMRMNQVRAQYASQGVDLDEDRELLEELRMQMLDGLINETLLLGYAADQGISASPEKMEAEYARLVTQVQGEEALEEILAAQGMDRDELMDMIADEVVLQELQDHEREARGLVVTDADIQAAYDSYREMVSDMPPLDEVRPYLEEELKQQQFMEIAPDLLDDLRAEGDIEIHL